MEDGKLSMPMDMAEADMQDTADSKLFLVFANKSKRVTPPPPGGDSNVVKW